MGLDRQFVVHKKDSYVVHKPSIVYRLNKDGSTSRITEDEHIARILSNHRVISEAEALILAYSDRHSEARKKPSAKAVATQAKPKRPESRDNQKTRVVIFTVLSAIVVLNLIAIIFRGSMVSFLEIALLLMVLPGLTFAATFVFVIGFFFYMLIEWVVIKLRRK